MESELCPSDEPIPIGGASPQNTEPPIPPGGGNPQNAEPLPGSEAEDLDSFNLIEPPPLDWRSDTSSEAGSLGASDDPSLPPSVGEAAGQGDIMAQTPDVSDHTTSPVDGQPELAGEEKAEDETAGLGEMASTPDVSDPPAASPVDGQLELAGKEKTLPVQLEEKYLAVEDEKAVELEKDEEASVVGVERQTVEEEEVAVMNKRPDDEDHTRIHALLNRLQVMGEEEDPYPETLKPFPHPHHHSPTELDRTADISTLHEEPPTETTGLLFSESHQRDLLGLLECTEIGPPPRHRSKPQGSYQRVPTGDVDAVVSVSYNQEDAQRFWGCHTGNGQQQEPLRSRDDSIGSLTEEDEYPEPVWMKRGEEPPREEEEAAREGDQSADDHPAYKDVPGPCDPDDLLDGVVFGAKYLGSTQLKSEKNPSTNARMAQAQEAVDRIKAPEGETQPETEVDLFISTQRIKVLTADTQSSEDSWRLNHLSGDLFCCPEDESLAHCISEDCRMGAGVAVLFKKKFGGVDELKEQKKISGQCAVLRREGRFVYYLITKKKYCHKPTYDSLRQSLEGMKSHCIKNGVTKISMPRIGCGLDRLKWDRVCEILKDVFEHTDINITVYTLPETKEAMMDHSLQMISYIADIGSILVLMARRKQPGRKGQDAEPASNSSSSSSAPQKKYCMICHVFSSEDAQVIAQAIGQAFGVAYQQFLQTNGIKPSQLRPGEYSDFLGSQELYNGDLVHFSDSQNIRDVIITKAAGEILGVAVVESGWGSILPTVVVANMLHGGPAERCGDLSIGDRIMSVNGTSLVGLPITTCHSIIRDLKGETIVKISIVHCPPVTMAIIKRPDPKYQLGFSVEDGIICSLMRGGIAERGGIRVGHRIIEINGQSVVATPHEKIIHILTNAIGEIHLKTMPASTYRLLTGQEQAVFL